MANSTVEIRFTDNPVIGDKISFDSTEQAGGLEEG